ncbi:MAG TPA: Os1348 family NHLP clan protein [Anaerolineae bacterium]|nr:Os1348 family NHLP clan protein [Anaerolineae bacterium]
MMTTASLSQIIGTAVIDDGFRSTLLSNPRTALARFDLEANEMRDIAAIRATTIEQFAEQLIVWMNGHELERV